VYRAFVTSISAANFALATNQRNTLFASGCSDHRSRQLRSGNSPSSSESTSAGCQAIRHEPRRHGTSRPRQRDQGWPAAVSNTTGRPCNNRSCPFCASCPQRSGRPSRETNAFASVLAVVGLKESCRLISNLPCRWVAEVRMIGSRGCFLRAVERIDHENGVAGLRQTLPICLNVGEGRRCRARSARRMFARSRMYEVGVRSAIGVLISTSDSFVSAAPAIAGTRRRRSCPASKHRISPGQTTRAQVVVDHVLMESLSHIDPLPLIKGERQLEPLASPMVPRYVGHSQLPPGAGR